MSKMKMVCVALVWLCILGVGVTGYRWIFVPVQEKIAEEEAVKEKQDLIKRTSADLRFTENVRFSLDTFSGYSVLRSDKFRDELGSFGYGLELKDDGADYDKRFQDLLEGKANFAVFTADAYIKACAKSNEIPGVISYIIDESRGADAAVGVSRTLENVDALNHPDTKFVVVPDSPSETFARVIISYFNLDKLGSEPFVFADSADALYNMYRKHDPNDKKIFVTWEPYVSKMIQNPDYKTLVDTSKFRGYTLDVIVVNREFLAKNSRIVKNVIESYARANFFHQSNMSDLLVEDSIKIGEPLKPDLADNLVDKIWWKNTRENYAHFGIVKGSGIQHIEDAIVNITRILVETGGIDKDPTGGHPNQLYNYNVLREMQSSGFHPGVFGDTESIRDESQLVALSDSQWNNLEPVGTLEVPKLVFPRGTQRLTETSKFHLQNLSEKLKDAPQFYLLVTGNAGVNGDLEANTKLAVSRAESAKDYLISIGIPKERIRAVGGKPSGQTIVTFVVGQQPY